MRCGCEGVSGQRLARLVRMTQSKRKDTYEDNRKRRDMRGYTPDGGGGHAGGGGKRHEADEKKQTGGRPSPRRGEMRSHGDER